MIRGTGNGKSREAFSTGDVGGMTGEGKNPAPTESTFVKATDERVIEFKVTTTETLMTYSGTSFVPNTCKVRLNFGKPISVTFDKVDEYGWGIDDPGGPDGAELGTDFGGGQFDTPANLPTLVREALDAVKWATR